MSAASNTHSATSDLTAASSVIELAAVIRSGQASAREVLEQYLARIERCNGAVNAIVRFDTERARARALQADEATAKGESWGPLHGVPFTLKDHIEAAGIGASLGTQGSEKTSDQDSVIAARLRAAGGIFFGKTNMSNSLQTNSQQFGRTSNPYDLARTPGGSSGGPAAAVAARLSPFDVGSDMSGSIRMPSHFCGVFGLRPTPHRVPLAGLVHGPANMPRMDRTLGVAGPIARSADDLALLFRVLAGPDPRDPDVPPVPTANVPHIEPRGVRIAIAPKIPGIRIAGAVSDAIAKLGARLAAEGVIVEERAPFPFEELLAAFRRRIRSALALAGKAGFAPPGTSALGGQEVTMLDLMTADEERDRYIGALDRFFAGYDAFLCPAATVTAFTHRPGGTPIEVDGEPVPSLCVDHPTILSTYTGSPSVVVPIAQDADGLPIGAQIVSKRWGDERLLALAALVERIVGRLPAPKMAL
jgi:amidase